MELRLVEAESIISAKDKEVADLKVVAYESSMIWNLWMLKIPASRSCFNLGGMVLVMGGWLSLMPWASRRNPPLEIQNRFFIQSPHILLLRTSHTSRIRIVRAWGPWSKRSILMQSSFIWRLPVTLLLSKIKHLSPYFPVPSSKLLLMLLPILPSSFKILSFRTLIQLLQMFSLFLSLMPCFLSLNHRGVVMKLYIWGH